MSLNLWWVLELNTYHICKFILEPDPWGWVESLPLGLGSTRAKRCIPGINIKYEGLLELNVYNILMFILEPEP